MSAIEPNGALELAELQSQIRAFVDERDWEQFHSPKNLAMALAVEAAELVEIFQWMTEAESLNLNTRDKDRAAQEIADVLIYLIRISERLDIDLLTAAEKKLAMNRKKYPACLVRGSSQKYSDYES